LCTRTHTHTDTHTQHYRDQCERDKTRSSWVNHGVGCGWEWRGICTVHTYGLASGSGSGTDPSTTIQQPFPWQFWLEAVATTAATDRVTDRLCDAIPPLTLPSTPDPLHATPFPLPPPFVSVSRKNYYNIAYVWCCIKGDYFKCKTV